VTKPVTPSDSAGTGYTDFAILGAAGSKAYE